MRSRLLLALTAAAALVTTVTAAPSGAVATPGIPPAIPGTSSNFQLVGPNPLFNRGLNAAPALFENYPYVGNPSDGSSTCPDARAGCAHVHPGPLLLTISAPGHPPPVGAEGRHSGYRGFGDRGHGRGAGRGPGKGGGRGQLEQPVPGDQPGQLPVRPGQPHRVRAV